MAYKRHLVGNKCDRLFQRPSKENSVRWYDSAPMGHNTIANMMPRLSAKAGLSRRYTNHSLRATSVNVLDNIGKFASRHIMAVTGHKSENSLKTYSGHTGRDIKRAMSGTISTTLRNAKTVTYTSTSNTEVAVSEPVMDTSDETEFEPLSNDEVNQIFESLKNDGIELESYKNQTENKENVPVNSQTVEIVNNNNNKTVNAMLQPMEERKFPMPMPVFNNCSNLTINFNFK